ncbi:YdaU family protein [Komagataeibacter sp. SM21]|uniref:YdaU family protein n=1 Tax=Komagataeibacter sp. SM21 TaxID=3242899 RepID=UPI0035297FF1
MSNVKTWMPLYIGDYLADTASLSTLQHGAYVLLMMEIWRKGPLPNNSARLARIAKTDLQTWQEEIWPDLQDFFFLEDDCLDQKRLRAERKKAEEISRKRSEAASKRHEVRTSKTDAKFQQNTCKPHANAEQVHSKSNAKASANAGANDHAKNMQLDTQSQSQSHISSLRSDIPPSPHRDERQKQADEFAEFWEAYPRRAGKDAARKAHTKARTRATQAEIMLGLSRHVDVWPDRKSDRAQFIPYPASWLNDGGWQDDPSASAAASPATPPQRTQGRPAIWDAVPDYPGV